MSGLFEPQKKLKVLEQSEFGKNDRGWTQEEREAKTYSPEGQTHEAECALNTAEAKGGFYAGHPQGHSWCCVDGTEESKELSLRSKEFRSEDYLLQNLAGGLLRT